MLEAFRKSLEDSIIVKRGEYNYFLHPIANGTPRMQPGMLKEIGEAVMDVADVNADVILTIETMGIPVATYLSVAMGIPLNIVRKVPQHLPGEMALKQVTGYSQRMLYLSGIKRGDRVLVVDDVLSTGGTLAVTLNALKGLGARVTDAVCIIERGEGLARIKRETDIDVISLVKIDVTDRVCVLGGV